MTQVFITEMKTNYVLRQLMFYSIKEEIDYSNYNKNNNNKNDYIYYYFIFFKNIIFYEEFYFQTYKKKQYIYSIYINLEIYMISI